jgi:hypothetical protein
MYESMYDIIAFCRTNQEVEKVLYRKRGFKSHGDVEMPRLLLAMENGQKEFVAHPAAQHVSCNFVSLYFLSNNKYLII